MPSTYSIIADWDFVLIKVAGKLTTEDLLTNFKQLESDPNCPDKFFEIVDFSRATGVDTKFNEYHRMIKNYNPKMSNKKIMGSILHCPSDFTFGIGRMVQTIFKSIHPQHNIRLTRNAKELNDVIQEYRLNKCE